MPRQEFGAVAPPSTIRRRLKTLSGRLARLAEKAHVDPQDLTKVRAELAGLERAARGRKRRAQGEGARTHILQYLKEHLGKPVFGEELREISGIQEWARRVRELRVELGYTIVEDGGRYTLVSPDPDPEAATRWARANEIRRRPKNSSTSERSARLPDGSASYARRGIGSPRTMIGRTYTRVSMFSKPFPSLRA